MLLSLNDLLGKTTHARDGEFGKVEDVLFDEKEWTVRYFVVNVGRFFNRKTVLVSPGHVSMAEDGIHLNVDLTRQQLSESPDIDTDAPLSRRAESAYHDYFGMPYYWGGPFLWGWAPRPSALPPSRAVGAVTPEGIRESETQMSRDLDAIEAQLERAEQETHVRSLNEVVGYAVSAQGETFGSIDDLIAADDSWAIRYLVVDTVRHWPGRSVVVSPEWVTGVSWERKAMSFNLAKESIKAAPAFESVSRLTREAEERLHRHYEREGYWSRGERTPWREKNDEKHHRQE